MARSHQGRRLVLHPTGGWGSTSTTFSRGPREKGSNITADTLGDVRRLCKEGSLKEALHILEQPGVRVDPNTYVCILQGCVNMKALAEGKQLHAHILQSELRPDIFLGNSLVNMYAKCGSMVDARRVFDEMHQRDVLTWTTMMAGYAKRGRAEEVFKIYEQMQWEGVRPNRVTFLCVLNASASLGSLDKGKQVHTDIIKAGIVSFINLENTLVHMYAKCGSIKAARQVFDIMAKRDVVSWNILIAGYAQHGPAEKAFKIYKEMAQEGILPDRVTFICLLQAFANIGALEIGKQVHADIIKAGIASDSILETALLDMYAKCGSVKDARQVFDNMAKRDVVSWSAMIAGYGQHGQGEEALKIYEQMQQERVTPNSVTFICILNACASLGALEKGKQIHSDIIQAGIVPCLSLENTIVDTYMKSGGLKDAHQVFNKMAKHDVVSWNAMIAGYAQHGHGEEALKIYEQMQHERVLPDRVTFICTLNACVSLGALEKGKQVHADIIKAGIASYLNLQNALVNMYAKCGSVMDALQVFDEMIKRDVVSWNAIIAGYAQHGHGEGAVQMFEKMQGEGVKPDGITFISILNACATLGALEKCKQVHVDLIKAGIVADVNVETALVDTYCKCGSVEDARELFDKMAKRDMVSWSAMITGYAQHGCSRKALKLFEQMQQEGYKPDGITFTSVISACSHMGLVDEGCHYFHSMCRDHGLPPTVEHFGCMVDLLSRAGRLDEAEELINKMPIEPGIAVWMTLLGACRLHSNVDVAERAAKRILKSDPQDSAAYVLLWNIYAAAGRWDDRAKLRKMLEDGVLERSPVY